ncbi:MAG: hypothetical protein NXI18_21635 [Alphaproteobacteria bacterium]|nr:hypothetical protein [Alphaproteobacteria bacterium]
MPFYAIWKPSDANPRVVALPDLEGGAAVSDEALRSELTTVAEMATSLDSESYRRSRLQEAAADRLKYKAAMNWLDARRDSLGSRSPAEACEYLAGFDRALAILLEANPVAAASS